MTKEDAFAIDLPKWPQCVIKGKDVTKEQAMDIIHRTDSFFDGHDGNDADFCAKARDITGCPGFDFSRQHNYEDYRKKIDEFHDKIGYVRTDYILNRWISCCWVGGPHGWCSPDGEIGFQNNIGKWPTVEEVYNDIVKIGKAFPYVEFTCTLLNSGEGCYDEDTKSLVTMQLRNGNVTFLDNPISLDKLEYGGIKNNYSNIFGGSESALTLDEIEKWWAK